MGVEDGTSNGGGTECVEGLNCLKSDGIGDRVRFGVGKSSDVASLSSGQMEGLRTYKRRKHAKSSADSKSEDTGRAFAKEDCQAVQQVCVLSVNEMLTQIVCLYVVTWLIQNVWHMNFCD